MPTVVSLRYCSCKQLQHRWPEIDVNQGLPIQQKWDIPLFLFLARPMEGIQEDTWLTETKVGNPYSLFSSLLGYISLKFNWRVINYLLLALLP